MHRPILTILTLAAGFSLCSPAAEQDAARPLPENVGNAPFPRIDAARKITFRLKAPAAQRVTLEGGDGLVAGPLDMTKDADGWWSVTTPPAVPGFHYYWFTVDGLRVNDPASRTFFGWGRETGGIEVPGEGDDIHAAKPVPHGTVGIHYYHSSVTGRVREVLVYTPPEYDRSPDKRYPVLYLLHGSGENQRGWFEQGRAGFILDNLLAAGRTVPMIVVSDSGYAAFPNAASDDRGAATAAFEQVALTELIPFIDGRFRTVADRESRAIAGLSMGGGQALRLGLRHPDSFAWVGGMSCPPRGEFDLKTAYDGAFRDPEGFNSRTRLLWLNAGTAEARVHEGALAFSKSLSEAGIRAVFHSSAGTSHEWQTWRNGLHDLAPRLFRSGSADSSQSADNSAN